MRSRSHPLRRFGNRELHQAQQRAVATLAHELGVEREPARRARPVGERLQTARVGRPLTASPRAAGTAGRLRSPAASRRRFRVRAPTCTGAEHAGFTDIAWWAQNVFRKA